MDSLDNLTWTSRRALCEQLAAFLDATEPDVAENIAPKRTLRQMAGELLVLLAQGSCASFLLPVFRRSDEDLWLRFSALVAILRSDLVLSLDDFETFLATRWALTPATCYLCRSGALTERARQWITTLNPPERASLLGSLPRYWQALDDEATPPPELVETLYQHWVDEDRFHPEMEVRDALDWSPNLRAALTMVGRPEAQETLARYLSEPEGWSRLPRALRPGWYARNMAHLLAAGAPPLAEFPFDQLRISGRGSLLPLIEAQYGTDELLLYTDEQLRRASSASGLQKVWSLLRALPGAEVDDFLLSLQGCPDRPGWMLQALAVLRWERWLPRDRNRAAEQLQQLRADPELSPWRLRSCLYQTAVDPSPADRELWWWTTLQEEHLNFPFAGILGLEALGEDSPEWRARLDTLTESPLDVVHLLACAALLRRGDETCLEPIEDAAREFSVPPWERCADYSQGLALRLLGERDAARYVGLMQAVVSQQLPYDHNGSPEQEAAFVLAQLATPEALTTLLRAHFTGSDYLRRALREYLPAAVARLEGEAVSITNRISIWRYSFIPP